MTTALISIAGFLLLVAFLAGIRIASKGRFTIESREILAATAVIGLGLFVFGEITEIAFGDIRLIRSIKQAAATPVSDRVGQQQTDEIREDILEFEEVEVEVKGAPERIPRLIETKATALSFQLGSPYYVAWVVAQYLDELTKAPFLRYLVFNDQQGRMVAIADARAIAARFDANDPTLSPEKLTDWIKEADIARLSRLPGYIDADWALTANTNTREALSVMLERNVESLPVINDSGRFIGVTYRSQLVGTILMALTAVEAD